MARAGQARNALAVADNAGSGFLPSERIRLLQAKVCMGPAASPAVSASQLCTPLLSALGVSHHTCHTSPARWHPSHVQQQGTGGHHACASQEACRRPIHAASSLHRPPHAQAVCAQVAECQEELEVAEGDVRLWEEALLDQEPKHQHALQQREACPHHALASHAPPTAGYPMQL